MGRPSSSATRLGLERVEMKRPLRQTDAAKIAGDAAANRAKDGGQSGAEQCQKAYHAALAFAKGSGKTAKQSAELAAAVAQRAAVRAELTPQEQVDCVVKAAQVRSGP